MRTIAIGVLLFATAVIVGFTALGPAAGVNHFRILVEVGLATTGVAFLLFSGSAGLWRAAWGSVAIVGGLVLGLLTLPVTTDLRREFLGPRLGNQQRGFVLSVLGRPDLVADGIGTSPQYGFRSGTRAGDVLIIQFHATQDLEDVADDARWVPEAAAIAAYQLHPPGSPDGQR